MLAPRDVLQEMFLQDGLDALGLHQSSGGHGALDRGCVFGARGGGFGAEEGADGEVDQGREVLGEGCAVGSFADGGASCWGGIGLLV